ncbi:MAG: hypothetical protein KatS3mg111_0973 [Pirellulaceae bacterium]|nr:MAG: hypothetical protein KatS3mg111_0973 [Pirellulaceae bacterium]
MTLQFCIGAQVDRAGCPLFSCRRPMLAVLVYFVMTATSNCAAVYGQSTPIRIRPPQFDASRFQGIFYADVAEQLRGELPTEQARQMAIAPGAGEPSSSPDGGEPTGNEDPFGWKKLIEPVVLEDLVKETKLRLDREITTPAAFSGGGFQVARREFSLLALLFAIIEHYPGEVRWKADAALARQRLTRAAANTKVGSIQTYREAKERLQDLDDLIRGSSLVGNAEGETDWSNLIDRVPVMQLLEWAYQQELSKLVANEASFTANADAVRRYAELVAVLGRILLAEDMPDATDADYQQFTEEMIEHARQVRLAVDIGNAEQARIEAAAIGQSCSSCHENFR